MDEINVYDNLIPAHLADYIETLIFGNCKDIEVEPIIDFKIKREPTAIENKHKPISFKHVLKSNADNSQHFNLLSVIPQLVCQKHNIVLQDIPYARIFLTVPYNTEKEYMAPHTDLTCEHGVVLYYINDADGDTAFYNKAGEIIKTVSPKKGRVVLFNGLIMHSGGIPKNGPRAIINYNILF